MQQCLRGQAASFVRGQHAAVRLTGCRPPTRIFAEQQQKPDVDEDAEERRLEALEANMKKASSSKKKEFRVKGMNMETEPDSLRAPWKEGELLPEGWEGMTTVEKVTELYVGKRGVLFWLGELTYKGVFVLVALWAAFRFLGPALGLYELADSGPPVG